MTKLEYRFHLKGDPDELVAIVNEDMKDGWELHGSPIVVPCSEQRDDGELYVIHQIGQALIKKINKPGKFQSF